ncbi:PilZ domain-containing protein [Thiohalophilus thiocyanatoxydans]|uniref:PilZ domain-containing protein n=1 Tax=Thiohalophilus thiocyanatoxydans TaxID=381308 RepID=A0A4R8IFL9_9GAMM|nr:PilZ domain-containing protein [Thiohalophilus thiocyanatoxydans]TDX99321.1 PilZ domain-containing protein [Thiohalophilus thiocyanatoxydans]
MDHRHGERVRALALVRVCHSDRSGEYWAGLLYNVSQDGMFVLSNMRPALNASLDVYIQFADNRINVCLPGQVVHACDHGFGLIFRQVNKKNRWLIRVLQENQRTKGIGWSIEDRHESRGLSKASA